MPWWSSIPASIPTDVTAMSIGTTKLKAPPLTARPMPLSITKSGRVDDTITTISTWIATGPGSAKKKHNSACRIIFHGCPTSMSIFMNKGSIVHIISLPPSNPTMKSLPIFSGSFKPPLQKIMPVILTKKGGAISPMMCLTSSIRAMETPTPCLMGPLGWPMNKAVVDVPDWASSIGPGTP